MAYEKTIWKNRNVERPKTFTFQENADGTVTLISAEGVVYEVGTPVNATTMNKIEDQLALSDDSIASLDLRLGDVESVNLTQDSDIASLTTTVSGNTNDITAINTKLTGWETDFNGVNITLSGELNLERTLRFNNAVSDVFATDVLNINAVSYRNNSTYINLTGKVTITSSYSNQAIFNDHANGQVTVSATGSTLLLGHYATTAIRNSAPMHFYNPVQFVTSDVRMTVSETGFCGTGGYAGGLTSTASTTGVNFRVWKTFTPSSISFSTVASNRTPYATNITQQGFLLYIEGEGTNGLVYWRGYYTA